MTQIKQPTPTFAFRAGNFTVVKPVKKTASEKARLKELKKALENPVFTKKTKYLIL